MIETPRLHLRSMEWDDVDPSLKVFGDPVVMAGFATEPFGRAQREGWVPRNLDHQKRYGHGLFTVILKSSGLVIGDCGLEQMELDDEQMAELGYDLRSDAWGQGLATEAAGAVRDYAFETLHLPKLVSLIRYDDRASQRVAEKTGMRLVDGDVYGDQRYGLYGMERHERHPAVKGANGLSQSNPSRLSDAE